MGRRALDLGEHGAVEATPQKRDEHGRWKRLPSARGAERWRARCYYRGYDGVQGEVSRVAPTKAAALASLTTALGERQHDGDVDMNATMPLVKAGEVWLTQIARIDSGLSERTVTDYRRTFRRYIDRSGSRLRGLPLTQANDPQRLRRFLQIVADEHGTGSAKICKSVLAGVLNMAVDNGTLPSNAIRQVRPVKAQTIRVDAREEPRDTSRAFTRAERDRIIVFAYALAAVPVRRPQTTRKRLATADLAAFMAGTGVRVTEARRLRWEHVDMPGGFVHIYGTKSRKARRRVDLPGWLAERMRERAERVGEDGYVFSSPHHLEDRERIWDQSNAARALARLLDLAGHGWATPHSWRRTVATLAAEAGVPLVQIADQLGHDDPSMTMRVYLGRDFMGDRSSLAAIL